MKKIKVILMCMIMCFGICLFSVNTYATDISSTDNGQMEEIEAEVISIYGSTTDNVEGYDMVIPAGDAEKIIKIKVKNQGYLYIDYLGNEVPKGVMVQLYSDLECTSKVGYSEYITQNNLLGGMKIAIPSKGDYYLQFDFGNYPADADTNITIKPHAYSGDNKTLTNKKWIGSYPYNSDIKVYHKVVISKPGYIKVEAQTTDERGYSVSNVTLCNSKKQPISGSSGLYSSDNYTRYYAVNKGTYYIAVKDYYSYKIRYTYTGVADKGGVSKAKSTTIKKGATVKGLVLSGEKTTKYDWFKLTLPKKQKLSMEIKVRTNETLTFKVIPANSRYILFGDTIRMSDGEEGTITSKEALQKGTYYIRVNKSDVKGSGFYQIKFK